jgi:hypothetical protein
MKVNIELSSILDLSDNKVNILIEDYDPKFMPQKKD